MDPKINEIGYFFGRDGIWKMDVAGVWIPVADATAYRKGDTRATKAAARAAGETTAPANPQPSVLDLTDEQLIELMDGKK